MAIYVKFEIPQTVRQFVKEFFNYKRGDTALTNVQTYSNKECTMVQCDANRFRSFDDLLECVNTYYPEITPKDLIHVVITLNVKNSNNQKLYPNLYHCSTIMKTRMLYFVEYSLQQPFMAEKYKSKYSWKELLAMLRINNQQQLETYINKYENMEKYVNRLLEEWKQHGKIIISVDYDDTLFHWKLENKTDIERTVNLARIAKETGAYLVVFTASNPERHEEIQKYCESIKLPIDSINSNPIDLPYGKKGKIYYNINLCDRSGLTEACDILESAMYQYRSYLQTNKPISDVA